MCKLSTAQPDYDFSIYISSTIENSYSKQAKNQLQHTPECSTVESTLLTDRVTLREVTVCDKIRLKYMAT